MKPSALGTALVLSVAAAASAALAKATPSPCVWAINPNPRCSDPEYSWNGAYPLCSLYNRDDGSPIPCQGLVGEDYCVYEGEGRAERPPRAASFHLHVFFPNPACTNCSTELVREGENFTVAGAMRLRAVISERLNELAEEIKGAPVADPIDVERAVSFEVRAFPSSTSPTASTRTDLRTHPAHRRRL